MHHIWCRGFWWNIKSPRLTWPPHRPDLAPCNFWLFLKLKSSLKGKRFHTGNDIQENMMEQLIEIGRTVWVPKVPTLKGTDVSLSYVKCFLYLMSSSINVSFSCYMAGYFLDRPRICQDVHSLYANTMPFSIKGLTIHRFLFPQGSWKQSPSDTEGNSMIQTRNRIEENKHCSCLSALPSLPALHIQSIYHLSKTSKVVLKKKGYFKNKITLFFCQYIKISFPNSLWDPGG